MRVTYHAAVRRELIAAAEYYEERQSGLGFSFHDEFQQAVNRILAAPHRSAEIIAGGPRSSSPPFSLLGLLSTWR